MSYPSFHAHGLNVLYITDRVPFLLDCCYLFIFLFFAPFHVILIQTKLLLDDYVVAYRNLI